jgi:hypothetical protein
MWHSAFNLCFQVQLAPLQHGDDNAGDSEEAMAEVEREFFSKTVNSGVKFDDMSPLDMELPEGADMDY